MKRSDLENGDHDGGPVDVAEEQAVAEAAGAEEEHQGLEEPRAEGNQAPGPGHPTPC